VLVAAAAVAWGLYAPAPAHAYTLNTTVKKKKGFQPDMGADESAVVANANHLFDEIDADGGGTLTPDELEEYAQKLRGTTGLSTLAKGYKVPPEFLRSVMAADTDGDGEVSREEFVAYMVDKERTLRDVFTRIDLAGTGWLSREEFSQAMRNFKLSVQPGVVKAINPSAITSMLKEIDQDGDGRISYQEFREAFLMLSLKDLQNIAPFWGVPSLEMTIVDMSATHGGRPWGHAVAGLLSSVTAITLTAPLERIYRLVVTERAPKGLGIPGICRWIWSREGIRGLFKGNCLSVMRVAPLKSLEFAFMSLSLNILTDPDEDPARTKLFMAGALAGALTRCITHPLETVALRYSVTTGIYKSSVHALHKMMVLEGVQSLYAGVFSCMLWSVPFSFLQYLIYDKRLKFAKADASLHGRLITRQDHMECCWEATWLATVSTLPLEVVRRKMQVQGMGGRIPAYRHALDALFKLSAKGDVSKLFLGIVPISLKCIPQTVISFYLYDVVKEFLCGYVFESEEVDDGVPAHMGSLTKEAKLQRARKIPRELRSLTEDDNASPNWLTSKFQTASLVLSTRPHRPPATRCRKKERRGNGDDGGRRVPRGAALTPRHGTLHQLSCIVADGQGIHTPSWTRQLDALLGSQRRNSLKDTQAQESYPTGTSQKNIIDILVTRLQEVVPMPQHASRTGRSVGQE